MDTVRILVCRNARTASILARNARASDKTRYPASRREASIWNIVACMAKGADEQACRKHAPFASASGYMAIASRRLKALGAWAAKNPVEAARLCAPLIAEYEARAKARAARTVVAS